MTDPGPPVRSPTPRPDGRLAAWICTLLVSAYAAVPLFVPGGPRQVRAFQAAFVLASAGWVGWMWLLRRGATRLPSLAAVLTVAILLRVALLAAPPNDDIYRYLWEGRVRLAGLNPYVHAPNDPDLRVLRDAAWSKINHPDHAAIYPPLAQLTFVALAWISPHVPAFRIAMFAADILTMLVLLRWLRRRGDDPRRVVLYALAPLVLWSFAREAHYDALMLLALAVLLERCDRPPFSRADAAIGGLALGAAIGLKWVAAVLAPWWIVRTLTGLTRQPHRPGWWAVRCTFLAALPTAVVLLAALPYLDAGWAAIFGPLRHFAREFHTLDWPRQQLTRVASERQALWLTIAAIVTTCGLVAYWRASAPTAVAWSFAPVLLLTPTLHPWYVTWPLVAMPARVIWPLVALAVSVVAAEQARYEQLSTGCWQMPAWVGPVVWGPPLVITLLLASGAAWRRISDSRRAETSD